MPGGYHKTDGHLNPAWHALQRMLHALVGSRLEGLEQAWIKAHILPVLPKKPTILQLEGSAHLLGLDTPKLRAGVCSAGVSEHFDCIVEYARWPFSNGNFDLVLINHAHVLDPSALDALLAEAYRVVKGEGLICVLGLNPLTPRYQWKALFRQTDQLPHIYRYKIEMALQHHGIQMLRNDTFDHFPESLECLPDWMQQGMDAILKVLFPGMGSGYAIVARKHREVSNVKGLKAALSAEI